MKNHLPSLLLLLLTSASGFSQSPPAPEPPAFTIVPLGVKGGLDESNLSSYMVAPSASNDYICLDAGTVYAGIATAVRKGSFAGTTSAIMRRRIKGYCISHPHLDHTAGLIIGSPEDTVKPIYGMPYTLKVLEEKYFTWEAWANFADQGEKPQLKKYHYVPLQAGVRTPLTGTAMHLTAYPLSHVEPYRSTAFLVESEGAYVLYLGDTGADTLEHAGRLQKLWEAVGPLISAGKLRGIFIETSFVNEQPDRLLFGHLTPRLLMGELAALGRIAGARAMKGLPVIITHRKPSGHAEQTITQQLRAANSLQVRLIFPRQGKRFSL